MLIIVPLFGMMIAFGDLWADQIALDHVAAVAVRRAAAAGGDSPELRSAIDHDLISGGLNPANVTVSVDPALAAWQAPVEVSLAMPVSVDVPFIGSWQVELKSQFFARSEVGPA